MGLLGKLLSTLSGNNDLKISEQLLFDKVVGFRDIVPGCGSSTIVQNVAIALSEKTKFNICVLDTNFLYPIEFPLLTSSDTKNKGDDLLDFSGDLSKITLATSYTNIYLVQLTNRNIVDMLSGKDSEDGITKLIANLKSYFDVILVDLSPELTNISIHTAIKCNKIIQVADTSLKCMYHLKKSLNMLGTLGVPLAKANQVILNKELYNVVLGLDSVLSEAGLTVLAKIPFSEKIAITGASGGKLYGLASGDADISAFNVAIDTVVESIMEKSPLNDVYMDVSKELERMERENESTKEETYLVEEVGSDEDEYDLESLPMTSDYSDGEAVETPLTDTVYNSEDYSTGTPIQNSKLSLTKTEDIENTGGGL